MAILLIEQNKYQVLVGKTNLNYLLHPLSLMNAEYVLLDQISVISLYFWWLFVKYTNFCDMHRHIVLYYGDFFTKSTRET